MATTFCCVISFCAVAADWSALPALSSRIIFTGHRIPATVRPPAALISSTAYTAAFLHDVPTAGMSPVSSAMTPIRISFAAPRPPQPQIPASRADALKRPINNFCIRYSFMCFFQ